MNALPEALEALTSRLDALEKRVHELEHPTEIFAALGAKLSDVPRAVQIPPESGIERASGAFPVMGRAMFGIAGAYVLRAVAESATIPRQVAAIIAIAYAVSWLVWAARSKEIARSARAVYACTSSLILAPMLWELTLRFGVFPPSLTAGVLVGFVALATVLAWKPDLAPVFWIAHGTAALTALALSIATRDLIPFIVALLLMVLICEYAVTRGRGQGVRPLVLAVTDAAVLALIFVYSGPQSTRATYPVVDSVVLLAPACMLFVVYAGSVLIKTVLLQHQMTAFETIQSMVAFLLVASTVLFVEPDNSTIYLGYSCLLLSAACYVAAFGRFRRAAEQLNFNIFVTWSACLFLAGTLWSIPPTWASACLGLAALAAITLGARQKCRSLDFHGAVYLAAAGIVSGLPEYVFRALAGPMPERPGWSLLLVSACCLACYAAGKERPGEDWQDQLLHLLPALLAASAFAALMAQEILQLAAMFITPDVFHVAFIRTLTVCSVALALAFGGARWQRLEMTRIAYAALAFMAAKLIFEDLRHGRMEFIAGSFFLFALTLITVPRLAKRGHKH